MATFRDQLKFGKTAESAIAHYMQGKGFAVMPVYETLQNTGKGPQVFSPTEEIVAPDMFVWRGQKALWIEAKHKTAFTWHRITQCWTTGIDRRHYLDYCKIDDQSPWPVWLMFLHRGGQAKDSPPDSPSGLYGNTLRNLRTTINHESPNWGNSGMVYWAVDSLKLLSPVDEDGNPTL